MARLIFAYLLSAPSPALPWPTQSKKPTGISFAVRGTVKPDEEDLQLFCDILLNTEKEKTLDTLREKLPFRWKREEEADVVNPFGDSRARKDQFQALWIFDTQSDLLRYINHDCCSQIPLASLRQHSVSLEDMILLGGPFPMPSIPAVDPEALYWEPPMEVDNRMRAFVRRLLRDFHYRWRHILRNEYNHSTLRVLARAIIRLSTLDFEVREDREKFSHFPAFKNITTLPAWEPFQADIVRVGNVWVMLCQDIKDGLPMVRQHIASGEATLAKSCETSNPEEARPHFMILSVKHVMLCHGQSLDSLKYTAPEPLFNGDPGSVSPSDLAMDYLIWATVPTRTAVPTSLQLLPIEIQDIILNYVSKAAVAAAQYGCLLGVGSPFLWKEGPLTITLGDMSAFPTSYVDSVIKFDEKKCELVYLARGS